MSNHGSLTLNDSASVAGNTTSDGGLGGGINSTGALALTDSASVLGTRPAAIRWRCLQRHHGHRNPGAAQPR